MEQEVDVAECVFTVWEEDEAIWKGADYRHAFFLKGVNPALRKVTVNAKIDVTLESMPDVMSVMKETSND